MPGRKDGLGSEAGTQHHPNTSPSTSPAELLTFPTTEMLLLLLPRGRRALDCSRAELSHSSDGRDKLRNF